MGSSPRLYVLGTASEPGAARLGRALDAPVVERGRDLVRARPEVVIVRSPVGELGRAAFVSTLAGAAAVVVAPIGAPAPLPWWGRRYHRVLVDTQEEARAWGAAGVALGRLVVVPPGPEERAALQALVHEVRAMALRRDIRPRAR